MLTVDFVQYNEITTAIVELHTKQGQTFSWLEENINNYKVSEDANGFPVYNYTPTESQILEAHSRILESTGISVSLPASIGVEACRSAKQNTNRNTCKYYIYSLYPQEVQFNGLNGTLGEGVNDSMVEHILAIRTEENRVYDLLDAATTVAEVASVEQPTWPEV